MSLLLNRKYRDKRAMTLIELILALVLLNVIILTGISMELGMRRIFVSTDFEAQLLAEAAPIFALAGRVINSALGEQGSPPFIPNAGVYAFRIDSNFNGRADGNDRWCAFQYIAGLHQLLYIPNTAVAGNVILSDKITNFDMYWLVDPPTGLDTGTIRIAVTMRKDPTQAAGYTNPEILVSSAAQVRAYPLN